MNVARYFDKHARISPGSTALIAGDGGRMTYRDLAGRAAALAGWMCAKYRLQRGDHVGLLLKNQPAYLEIMLACWWVGLVPVPINAKLHDNEVAVIIEDCRAKLLFADRDLDHPPIIDPASAEYAHALAQDPEPMAECRPHDLAWLFYTSGTTGKPKGAMITHGNLRAMTQSYFIDVDRIERDHSIIHAAPMSHGSGLYILPHAAMGAAQIIPASGGFDPAEITTICGREHARTGTDGVTMFMAPTMLRRFVHHVGSGKSGILGLKTIVYGGAPIYQTDLAEAHQVLGFKLAQIYGQGESPMTITALDKAAHRDTTHPHYQERLCSAGTVQSVCDVKIIDEQGAALEPGRVGEILVKGPSVVPGYWMNKDATRATMGDGWLRTGDLGSMDEDGFLTIKDRSKDLIISGGANIYPKEVEDVLLTHHALAEAAVVGMPDPEWGEIVTAYIVSNDGAMIDPAGLDQHCLAHLARFKRPKHYIQLPSLPKNAYGKILKRELRDRT